MRIKHTLKPVFDKNSKILILGSLPSVKSREDNFYYANKNNRFWKIIETIFMKNLESSKDKEMFLIKNNIALWDVIKECDITGSSDASIKNVIPNDINFIKKNSNIKYILVTGKTALKYYEQFIENQVNIKAIYLPSPSSANATFSLEKLVEIYSIIPELLE